MNPYRDAREKKGLSIREAAANSGVDRRAMKAIEEDEFETAKLSDLVKMSHFLGVNLYQIIREKFSYVTGEIYEEEMDAIINRLIGIQMDLIYEELGTYAKLLGRRVDDFNVREILSNKTNLYKLIALNSRLKNKEVSPQEAIRIIPPMKGALEKRKKE